MQLRLNDNKQNISEKCKKTIYQMSEVVSLK
jgi:hypothetical protein